MVRAETRHRMTRRLANWDYAQRAIYMITITLEDRSREWLGHLVNLAENAGAREAGVAAPGGAVPGHSWPGNWAIAPTPFGEAALEALHEMPRRYPQVELLAEQLMPEHLHFVLFVKEPLPKPLGQLVRGFKAGAVKRWKALAENAGAREAGVAAPGGVVTGGAVPGHFGPGSAVPGHSWPGLGPAWAEGFQDTILFRDGQLKAMIAYVGDNPRRLAEKRANPALFRRVARLERPLDGGRIIGAFEALGNRHLLDRPLHQVQCSRRFLAYRRVPKPGGGLKIVRDAAGEPMIERETPDYRERLEAAHAAAAHGAVTLSPCISDGERQIAREALKRRLPIVALKNMGFAKLEKPSGGYFEACAEGRLLLLAPAAWPCQTQAKDMTRFDATALNRIAQWLAGDGAIEINYHGMRPANIDELAEKAVEARKGGGDVARAPSPLQGGQEQGRDCLATSGLAAKGGAE